MLVINYTLENIYVKQLEFYLKQLKFWLNQLNNLIIS